MSNKVALITGALGDIGSAIAIKMAEAGIHIVLNDIREPAEGEALKEKLRQFGVKVGYYRADVTNPAAVQEMVEEVCRTYGDLTIGVSNAAVVQGGKLVDISYETWVKHINVNLNGSFIVAQAVSRQMILSGKGGQLVFISSWVQDVPHATTVPYCVSKSGIKLLMKGFAKELAPHGIRANAIAPGILAAGLSAQVMRENPKLRQELSRKIPLGYLQSPEQVADAALFLCSSQSDYMTGSVLTVDGGISLFYDADEME